MSGMRHKAVFVGSTQVLVDCIKQWIASGGEVEAVISDCSEVGYWSATAGVSLISPKQDLTAYLANKPFDYLFSIVNHAILPDELVTLPERRAINYHDSLLPSYAGFNATSWSIIDGADTHGVTWHSMTAD
nr:thioester reductase [Alphaproteobacteria bacterium]